MLDQVLNLTAWVLVGLAGYVIFTEGVYQSKPPITWFGLGVLALCCLKAWVAL